MRDADRNFLVEHTASGELRKLKQSAKRRQEVSSLKAVSKKTESRKVELAKAEKGDSWKRGHNPNAHQEVESNVKHGGSIKQRNKQLDNSRK